MPAAYTHTFPFPTARAVLEGDGAATGDPPRRRTGTLIDVLEAEPSSGQGLEPLAKIRFPPLEYSPRVR